MKSWFYSSVAVLALALGAPGQSLPVTNLSAFTLVKVGDKAIAPQAKDKITQIHSEKSSGGLVPAVWYIDYLDATAAFRTTEVKFVDGKVAEVKHPKRLLDTLTGTKLLEWRKLKIDSNRALAIALKEPALEKSDLRAVQFWLDRTESTCTWRIHFWAALLGRPDQVKDVGEVFISSRTGEVIKNDIHF
jgi:hypothetical protein